MAKKKEKRKSQKELNKDNLDAGVSIIRNHPLFGGCMPYIRIENKDRLGSQTMGIVYSNDVICLNVSITLTPMQWAYVIAHNILHLAFGHFDADKMPAYPAQINGKTIRKVSFEPLLWNMACDIYINKFLSDIKFGQSIHNAEYDSYIGDELSIYETLLENGINGNQNKFGTGIIGSCDMKGLDKPIVYDKARGQHNRYATQFTYALAHSVSKVVSEAGGHTFENNANNSSGKRAAKWFVDHYPLLGGLAAHFKLIEDYRYCNQNDIHIAAIDITCGEIYINPTANFTTEEWKFVLAHEYLHAGLQHHNRCNGREHYLWNVACDYVINGWLVELQIGVMPDEGLLYDEELKGLSAESIYDLLLSNIKKYSKLSTFRGFGKGDIIGSSNTKNANSVSLDDFCKSALQQGLEFHQSTSRGFIPAELIEEIRALSMPPIPWDVALAKWFDVYFEPLEKHRSYARPSRRQACTPDIPRPKYCTQDIPIESRTFGVVIDTSGSMAPKTIGKALGAIASYSVSHDVPFARVVFCDAAAYDAGYLSPEDIAGRVSVKGRGGTILQPAVHLLENAKDFPKDGPILIITDGGIEDHMDIKHEHAFLLPKESRLPFRTKGQLFYFDN